MSRAKFLRRTVGGVCLSGALILLASGETQPPASGSHLGFAIYWLGCFLLAVIAMVMAMLDLFTVRREARQAQRHLFEETLVQIQAEKRQRRNGGPPSRSAERNDPPRSNPGLQPDK